MKVSYAVTRQTYFLSFLSSIICTRFFFILLFIAWLKAVLSVLHFLFSFLFTFSLFPFLLSTYVLLAACLSFFFYLVYKVSHWLVRITLFPILIIVFTTTSIILQSNCPQCLVAVCFLCHSYPVFCPGFHIRGVSKNQGVSPYCPYPSFLFPLAFLSPPFQFPAPSLPSISSRPLKSAIGSGEHCRLSSGILCILALKSDILWQQI